MILNHSETLRLDSRFVEAGWLLDFYRMAAPVETPGFRIGNRFVTGLGDRVYLDTLELAERAGPLLGALPIGKVVAIAAPDTLLLVTPEGEIIERLSGADGVPAGLYRIGRDRAGRLVASGAHGDYSADLGRVEWRPEAGAEVTWSEPAPVPPGLRERLVDLYRGKGLPLERVILDIHSGRILGGWGVYLVDVLALLFSVLVVTGLWMWARGRR